MSAQDLNDSAAASDLQPETSNTFKPRQTRFNVWFAAAGLLVALLLLLAVPALIHSPEAWYVVFLLGLITGFALGTVFGLWIAKSIGHELNFQNFAFATGVVVLNACVGFFGYAWLTSPVEAPSLWPSDRNLGWSIGTAGTLVSAAILCLVNFVYHSRDQKRIHALRSVLTKNRAKIAGAESKAAIAQSIAEQANTQAEQQQRRAEEAERKLEELRVIAESAQDEAMQAWTAAQTAQQTAQQAQQIAEREKRWRANRALLLGRWQCVEYSALPRSTDADRAREIHQELDRDRDILFFGADDRFMLFHPGRSSTWMARITTAFRDENTHERDVPFEKGGRWSLAETGDAVVIEYADGTSETMKVKTLTKTRLTVDKSSEEWDLLRTLVKIG